jgi:cell volume regulation protein A
VSDGEMILTAGALLTAGIAASLLAGRLRVPGLLLVLAIGMIVGSDGTGWIAFDDYQVAQTVGIIALALILFEGGLAAGLPEIRPVLGMSISLALIGTVVTAALAGLAAGLLFDVSTSEGMLIGSIVAATDGAAVFAILRGSSLKRRLARTLEGESGLNDPIAILLVLGFIEVIKDPSYGLVDFAELFVMEIGIGLVIGLGVGWLAVRAFQGVNLATPGLYPVASLAMAALSFGAADALHGSGFLAVYLTGLLMGSTALPALQTVVAFHAGIAWVAQLGMFLTLGLLVFPSQLLDVAVEGTVLALVLAFVARPVAVWISTAGVRMSVGDRSVLGWAGLRGAVPVVLATFPVIEGIEGSQEFFDIVFFAVVLSTLLQGGTIEPVARWLKATSSEPALPPPLVEIGTIRGLGADVLEVPVREGDAAVGARVRELGLPREALVSVLVREGEALLPRGSTRIHAGDRLHILTRREALEEVRGLRERWRVGPVGPPERPAPALRGRPVIASIRPWDPEADGDPAAPQAINGREVIERLSLRRDSPGALVRLDDGRYAFTSPVLVIGSRGIVSDQARKRARETDDDGDAAWFQDVLSALAR